MNALGGRYQDSVFHHLFLRLCVEPVHNVFVAVCKMEILLES